MEEERRKKNDDEMLVAPTPDDHAQEAEADTVGTITRVPYSVRPFSGTVYVGSGPSRQFLLLDLQEGMSHSTTSDQESTLILKKSEIKGQHALRRSVCTLEDQVRELVKGDQEENKKLKMIPYVAPTTPVAHVDRTDPDDPSPRPTRRPRHDDPYVMVRDAIARDEGDDASTTSDPQPSHPPGSPRYHL
ncbi:hypothetical protein Tco_0678565 [Tanacetum coccineum]|uniref:Uncharacterized protein n=1 Tax=Tanacetum coccineum TaxID=301880 RepID=A0ABQ4XFF2_9ASTR